MFWWLLKWVLLGPLLRLLFRPRATGLGHIPRRTGAVLAANHVSALDTVLMPLMVPGRRVAFLGKAELFGRWYRWFFQGVGVIPIRRGGGQASQEVLRSAVEAARRGRLLGIFPEGTRSPDGRLYRGKTGVARLAAGADVPVIPIGIVGTRALMPPGRLIPRPGRVEIRFGAPIRVSPEVLADRSELRRVTDRVMAAIAELSGQEIVDEDAARAKARLRRAAAAAPETDGSVTP